MILLNAQIAQGTADAGLANDVQSLNTLSMAQGRGRPAARDPGQRPAEQQLFADGELQALTTAQSAAAADQAAFDTTATRRREGCLLQPGQRAEGEPGRAHRRPTSSASAPGPHRALVSAISAAIDQGCPRSGTRTCRPRSTGCRRVEQVVAGTIVARASTPAGRAVVRAAHRRADRGDLAHRAGRDAPGSQVPGAAAAQAAGRSARHRVSAAAGAGPAAGRVRGRRRRAWRSCRLT